MVSYTEFQNENSINTDIAEPYSSVTPSDETYQEIENLANNTTESATLRSAPPGGTPIGGVNLETPSVLTLAVPFIIYLLLKRIKRHHYIFFRQRMPQ